ncbi:unnamed protein product [Macrosiphum euphorbiae]|uniref:THAP-type domain-containing protein n=1 Tax=Macrosiphum euphorbiae TaxID=13131 RepID=A0AAV0Y8K3_9HEMI|nr:unnamed protein product [Macrosiphum euphorbiae]
MPTTCCVRGQWDVTRRLQWIQALDRENFVPTNNILICESHFTTNDYQKRPDLIKLTHTAVPRLKSSRMPARKLHSHLLDHTYVLKLPEEIIPEVTEDIGFQKLIGPSKCVVHTLDADESHPSFKIPESFKKTFQPPEKNWERIPMIQQNTIHDLRKKVKFLQQKIRRYSSTIETLKEQLDIMINY